MSVSTVAHLNFTGNAREALHFYHSVFGGQVMIATYAQAGVPQDSPDADQAVFNPVDPDSSDADHVAFGMVAADNGFRLAAYDVFGGTEGGVADSRASGGAGRRASGLTHTESFFLLLNGETLDELTAPGDRRADAADLLVSAADRGRSANQWCERRRQDPGAARCGCMSSNPSRLPSPARRRARAVPALGGAARAGDRDAARPPRRSGRGAGRAGGRPDQRIGVRRRGGGAALRLHGCAEPVPVRAAPPPSLYIAEHRHSNPPRAQW
jgi:PhnB protein